MRVYMRGKMDLDLDLGVEGTWMTRGSWCGELRMRTARMGYGV